MRPSTFRESNRELVGPDGDDSIIPLPVYTDGQQCISRWEMSRAERLTALREGAVWCSVLSGVTQPPVLLSVDRPFAPGGAPEADPAEDPAALDRDTLGRLVRAEWVAHALTRPRVKPSHVLPYDELAEVDKEADRRIGEAVAAYTLGLGLGDIRAHLAVVARAGEAAEAEAGAAVGEVPAGPAPSPAPPGSSLTSALAALAAEVADCLAHGTTPGPVVLERIAHVMARAAERAALADAVAAAAVLVPLADVRTLDSKGRETLEAFGSALDALHRFDGGLA